MDLAFAAGVADEDELSDRVFLATLYDTALASNSSGQKSGTLATLSRCSLGEWLSRGGKSEM